MKGWHPGGQNREKGRAGDWWVKEGIRASCPGFWIWPCRRRDAKRTARCGDTHSHREQEAEQQCPHAPQEFVGLSLCQTSRPAPQHDVPLVLAPVLRAVKGCLHFGDRLSAWAQTGPMQKGGDNICFKCSYIPFLLIIFPPFHEPSSFLRISL